MAEETLTKKKRGKKIKEKSDVYFHLHLLQLLVIRTPVGGPVMSN